MDFKGSPDLRIGGLEVNIPIVQGGMGIGVSLAGLASAVANEGGKGVISSAALGKIGGERLVELLAKALEEGRMNLYKSQKGFREVAEVALPAMNNLSMQNLSMQNMIATIGKGLARSNQA
jgi:nitronate monooxygenase